MVGGGFRGYELGGIYRGREGEGEEGRRGKTAPLFRERKDIYDTTDSRKRQTWFLLCFFVPCL